jgi:hypothetical protein
MALSRTNIEKERENKALQEENKTLAQNNTDLKREGVELTRTNEALFRVNQNLIQDTVDKRQKLTELEAKVRELTDNEKALYSQLAGAGQSFTQSFTALRQGRLILRAGGELSRRTIPAHLRPEAVRRELIALLEDASASAQRLGAQRGENGRAVAIVRKRVVTLVGIENTDETDSLNALIENLTGSNTDTVVLANGINNTVAGEQVRIELSPRPAVPIFKKGEVVASRIINARQPVEKIADDLVAFLQKDVRDAATRAGTIPQIEPETGVSLETLTALVNRMKRARYGVFLFAMGPCTTWDSHHDAAAIHEGTPRPEARSVERPSGPRSKSSSIDCSPQAVRTSRPAPTRAVSPMMLTTTQARRNQPFVRSTGIQAQAERQIRRTASAVVATRSGNASRTQSLTSGLPSGTPTSSAVIAMAPQIRTTTLNIT